MSNAFLRIRGRGVGDEAVVVSKIARMYSRYAEMQGWTIAAVPASVREPQAEVVALVRGEHAYRKLKYESGVHRVKWAPSMEEKGRVLTSKIVVAVAPEGDELDVIDLGPDRSPTIRTYNIPQNRVTDHRIGLTLDQLDLIMDGGLEPIIEALTAHVHERRGLSVE